MLRYRSFEFVLGWPDGEWIGNMLLIGHKEARLIYSYDFDKTYKQTKDNNTTRYYKSQQGYQHDIMK